MFMDFLKGDTKLLLPQRVEIVNKKAFTGTYFISLVNFTENYQNSTFVFKSKKINLFLSSFMFSIAHSTR